MDKDGIAVNRTVMMNGRPQFLQYMQQMNQYVFAGSTYKMKTENRVQRNGEILHILLD